MCIVSHISINEAYNKVCSSDTFFVRGDRVRWWYEAKEELFPAELCSEQVKPDSFDDESFATLLSLT